ncbi:kelch-like protein 2 [Acyrthosiphon pisum]|uniref:BTB domain-containing protein n=1 Tax=Acyrthosiphon pisum TaxID=7029 RepID=A0A8R2F6S9_ACYPI|nr:kelch-like protein 2 [Acyrthosiphon pisum]|eukprot:XP_008181225.1 PREDICTED: kelch-like protein 2 [Acyrthosiphon pisum]
MENTNQIPDSRRCKPDKLYKKSSFVDIYERLQSLWNGEFFCDVKLQTDDQKIISAHKVVLSAASPYFYAMFTHFAVRNHDLVALRQIDHTALLHLVDFIYSGKISVTEKNVLILLPAADLLQLQGVKEACCDFLQSQLCPSNCIGINTIADLHSCTKLITSSEIYIHQHFSEVVGDNEFLSLSLEQVIKLISSDRLPVSSDEKVFESVISWVKYDLGSRQCVLSQLMQHVRLPLTSKDYILKKVAEEPLIKNCLKCIKYTQIRRPYSTKHPE